MDGLEYYIPTDEGEKKVVVNVLNVVYDPPLNVWRASSDWDAMGTLEIDWEIVSVEGGVSVDEEYIDYLLRNDIMDRINNRDEDY